MKIGMQPSLLRPKQVDKVTSALWDVKMKSHSVTLLLTAMLQICLRHSLVLPRTPRTT